MLDLLLSYPSELLFLLVTWFCESSMTSLLAAADTPGISNAFREPSSTDLLEGMMLHHLATLWQLSSRSQTTWAWVSILELSLEWDLLFFTISIFDSTKTEGIQAIPTSQQTLVYLKLNMICSTSQISMMCSRWCERFWVRSLWEAKFEWWQIIEHWYELTIALQLAKSCLIHWWRPCY